MRIGSVDLSTTVLVVAEIGNNHEGSIDVARRLVREAAASGVHAVKLQTFRTEHYVSRSDTDRFRRLQSFELSEEQTGELAALARSLGMLFLSTPFDLRSAAFLSGLVDAFKVASGDNDFFPLLDRVAESGKPVIVSTGASQFAQVQRAVAFLRARVPDDRVAILHCVSSYPTPPDQANLRSIPFLAERFPGVTVGYSDHTMGTVAAVLAVALGARIIEKHFTLDKQYSAFRDHQLSADPVEMRELVSRVQAASAMLGKWEKDPQDCEAGNRVAIRRSVVAGADLPSGHRIRFEDLTWIRPGGGLAPGQEDVLIGRSLRRAVKFGEVLAPRDVE